MAGHVASARTAVVSGETWTVGKVLRWATDDFKARGIDSPRLDAELLLGFVLGMNRIQIITHSERPLDTAELSRFRELIRRRRALEPVAYLLGEREFYGRPFGVNADVLIPRPDTEILLEVALRRSQHRSLGGRALDLCTGSGCVAISFAKERSTWHVSGSDLSAAAIVVACRNALRLGAVWNVCWYTGDLFSALPLGSRFEVITANPPYIPEGEVAELDPTIKDFEPYLALSGGRDGLSVTRTLLEEAPKYLAPGGLLAMEIMSETGAIVAALMEQRGFQEVEISRDYGGHERVVSGVYR